MDKEIFRKTEGKLYRYFSNKKKLDFIKKNVAVLQRQVSEIEEDIRKTNVRIDYFKSTGNNERVQSSSDGTSYAERELCNAINMLEKEIVSKQVIIYKEKEKLREIERLNSSVEFTINMMDEESKRFLELKYSDRERVIVIADKMSIAVATVYRLREEIVNDFYILYNQ